MDLCRRRPLFLFSLSLQLAAIIKARKREAAALVNSLLLYLLFSRVSRLRDKEDPLLLLSLFLWLGLYRLEGEIVSVIFCL